MCCFLHCYARRGVPHNFKTFQLKLIIHAYRTNKWQLINPCQYCYRCVNILSAAVSWATSFSRNHKPKPYPHTTSLAIFILSSTKLSIREPLSCMAWDLSRLPVVTLNPLSIKVETRGAAGGGVTLFSTRPLGACCAKSFGMTQHKSRVSKPEVRVLLSIGYLIVNCSDFWCIILKLALDQTVNLGQDQMPDAHLSFCCQM